MKTIITLSRLLSAFLCFTNIIGILWFSKSLDALSLAYGIVTAIAFFAAAFMPRAFFNKQNIPAYLIALYTTAIIMALPMIYLDITLINGADYPAMCIRFFDITLFIVMTMEVKMK